MLRTLAVLFVITVAIVGAFVSPFYGLLGYLWFALFRPQEWVWFDISSLRLSLVLGLLVLGRSLFAGYWPLLTHRLAVAMVLFLMTAFVAQANAVAPAVGWEWIEFLFKLLVVCLLIARLADDVWKLSLTVGVIAGSLGFHTAKAGAAYVLAGGVRFADGLGGAFVDNNGYALAAVVITPLLWATAQAAKFFQWPWLYRGFLAAVPLTMITVVGTYSRGGLLGLLAVGATALLFAKRRLLKIAGVVTLALVVGPFVAVPSDYQDRMATIATYEEVDEESALSRLHFWAVAVTMAEANPLGVGLRNFDYAYDRYDHSGARYGSFRSVHSSHFQVLAENGFLGLGLWIFLFVEAFRTCITIRGRVRRSSLDRREAELLRTMASALMMSMAGFLVSGSFIALALNDLTWLIFGLVIALDLVARRMIAVVDPPAGAGRAGPRPVRATEPERPAARVVAAAGSAELRAEKWN